MATLLFIQPSLTQVGGVEKVLPLVVTGLEQKGHTTIGLSFYDPVTFKPTFFSTYETLAEVGTRHWLDKLCKVTRRVLAIRSMVSRERPNAIIVSTQGAALITLLYKKLSRNKVPVFVYVHQSLQASDTGYLPFARWLYQDVTGFIVVSKGLAEEVKGMFTAPVVVAYNPLLPLTTPMLLKKVRAAVPIFITAARLEAIRGLDILVRLMGAYLKERPGELWIFGDGSQKAEVTAWVESHGLSSRILFKGVVSDISPYLHQADVYVSCARSEAFGMSLVEALRAGLPIVCTDVPYGPREIMKVAAQEKLTYPYVTPYGVLFELPHTTMPGVTMDTETEHMFTQAVAHAAALTEDFRAERINRSADFSPDQTISRIQDFLVAHLPV